MPPCPRWNESVARDSVIHAKPRYVVLRHPVSESRDRVLPDGGSGRDGTTEEAVLLLEKSINDPTQGLPEPVFRLVSSLVPMVNVDLLIRNRKGETLLTWREDDFYPAGWHIPGGIIRYKEAMSARIRAVAKKELGVRVRFDPMPLAVTEVVTSKQRIRGHFISFLYACTLSSALSEKFKFRGGRPDSGEWAWHAGCPRGVLAIQKQIYGDFLKRRNKHT